MKFVRRKATTSKSKHKSGDFEKVKEAFLDDLVSIVEMEEIPPELILNWDQTGIHLVPASGWTMDIMGSKRVEISGGNDKRQITAIFCGSLTGDFLPIQLIYQGKTNRCHPHFQFQYHSLSKALVHGDTIHSRNYHSLCGPPSRGFGGC